MLASGAHFDDVRHLAAGLGDAQALKARAVGGDREALRDAARQFESLLVTQMLKTMRETRFNDEDDPLSGGDGAKLYRDLLDQQWAASITKGRGLGFAEMMLKAMERQGDEGREKGEGGRVGALAHSVAVPPPATSQTSQTSQTVRVDAGGAAADRKSRFLEALRPQAEAAAAATGVPANFILAQAALESGWGERAIRAADGRDSHNLFGIKAGRGWPGASVETLTTEYRQGVPMQLSQSFRAYADHTEAFTDYANLLKRRYGEALAAGDDAAGFARGLAANGYATDPRYAEKLQAVIASVATAGV